MKRFLLLLLAAVLALPLTGCGGARDKLTSLEDITDDMLISGELGYSQTMWSGSGSRVNDDQTYQASWRSMTGTDEVLTLERAEDTDSILTYTADDGDFRLALIFPDDTVLTLAEGENAVVLPAGTTRVVLAAYRTAGAFSLEIAGA